ncbi:MAG: hypothetical protein JXR13_06235 [Thalassovita sp.]
MFLELIATFIAGIAAAGLMMLLNKGLGGRLPRWLVPVAAGAAMIAATISNEYSWFGRTSAALPPEVQIAQTVESQTFYRPWTYVSPFVERFMAVDTTSRRTNANVPDQHMVDLLFFGRWSAVQVLPVLVDCATLLQAPLDDSTVFDDDGAVRSANWAPLAKDHGVVRIVCEGP